MVDVPTPLPLSRMPQVELMQTGTWNASTGQHTFTTDDLANAIGALECPAVRRPIIKLGHTDPRFDGEPAVGWLANMATTDDGHTLVADFVGMPGWLGPILASAFPDRSIEGQWDYKCALGHKHGFVLTGLALLGVTHPAIGTLSSLQDVASLYGVAASTPNSDTFSVQMKGSEMPETPQSVAASVTTEDVRRAYYDDAPWSYWIEEFSLDPLQLIVIDDESGERLRVPVAVSPDRDGAEGVSFGDPVQVVVRYEDATAAPVDDDESAEQVAASAAPTVIRYASRAESRPGQPAAASTLAAAADGAPTEGGSGVEITNEQLAALRTALGLADDADIDAIIAAVEALAADDSGDSVAAARALPEGVVTIESGVLASLQRNAELGRAAAERQAREDRENLVGAAIGDGRIPPARREHWLTALETDFEGNSAALAGLQKGLIPVAEMGHAQVNNGPDDETYSWPDESVRKGA